VLDLEAVFGYGSDTPEADRPEPPTPEPEAGPGGQADTPDLGETSGGWLPPGWPANVSEPDWWPELAGLGIPIRAARPERCGGCGFGVSVNWQDGSGNWRWSCPSCGRRSETSAEADAVASPDAGRGRAAEPAKHPWPGTLADWTMLLTPGDLPERFTLRPAVEVVDPTRFLAALKADIRRGPSAPRARYGALQADLGALRRVLLGGPTEETASRMPQNRRKAGWSIQNTSDATGRLRGPQGPSRRCETGQG
jgi:hypothetical protein